MPAAHVEIHLQNRILLSLHKDGTLSAPEQLFPCGGRGSLHKHTWKSLIRGLSCRVKLALSWLLSSGTYSVGRKIDHEVVYLVRGSWVSQETRKFRNQSQKWLCIEEETSCTWQSATKSERAVMENGCVYRKSTSRPPLARAAALFTRSQRIKFGSSCRACHAREVIKTELKWFHNSNWKQEWGKC